MKNKISTEYAEALFTLGMEEGSEAEYYEALTLVRDAFRSEAEFMMLLSSPSLEKNEKIHILDAVFSHKINENVLSLLKLMSERGRIGEFFNLFDDYEKIYNFHKRVIVASVTSAVELTEGEKEKIKEKLISKYNIDVRLECTVDESILGGIIIKTDDTIIDGSLKRKLRDIKDVISK